MTTSLYFGVNLIRPREGGPWQARASALRSDLDKTEYAKIASPLYDDVVSAAEYASRWMVGLAAEYAAAQARGEAE